MPRPALAIPLLFLPMAALADASATVTNGNGLSAPPTEWLGETPHLVMMGTVNGYAFDIQYPEMTAAPDIAEFAGKREYQIDGDRLRYVDFEFTFQAVIGGIEKEIELEFENFDFDAEAVPGAFMLQSGGYPRGALSNMEVEFEWKTAGASTDEEVENWDGTFTFALDEGTESDLGTLAGGKIGGHVDASRGEDRIVISFTVPVTEVEIDD